MVDGGWWMADCPSSVNFRTRTAINIVIKAALNVLLLKQLFMFFCKPAIQFTMLAEVVVLRSSSVFLGRES